MIPRIRLSGPAGGSKWRRVGLVLQQLLAPPQCPGCRRRVARAGFCLPCACQVRRGLGRERRRSAGRRLQRGEPPGRGTTTWPVIAAGPLAGSWGRAVRAYKEDPVPSLAGVMVPLLARTAREDVRAGRLAAPVGERPDEPVLIPVPMAPARRRERGFNPAEDLARSLAGLMGCRVASGWLRRSRWRRPLRGLNARDRRVEVADAFIASGTMIEKDGVPRGPVLLVDDVYTTGATLDAAAAALEAAGIRVAGALVLGRTPRHRRARVRTKGGGGNAAPGMKHVPRDRYQRRPE